MHQHTMATQGYQAETMTSFVATQRSLSKISMIVDLEPRWRRAGVRDDGARRPWAGRVTPTAVCAG